jgi:hypothetical protein
MTVDINIKREDLCLIARAYRLDVEECDNGGCRIIQNSELVERVLLHLKEKIDGGKDRKENI